MRSMRRAFGVLVYLCVLALACAAPALAAAPKGHAMKHPVVWAAGDIKWADSPALPGAKVGPSSGKSCWHQHERCGSRHSLPHANRR